ncbi:MAG: SelB C-terminal domain-containing protein, partial [Chloroflexi bacterium]|nr:SelB C-terminal domain-containing protein [Chloroflexota bacterium]
LIDGALSVGQEVEILPSGKVSRIRGLQSHRQKVDRAMPGRRLAINLSGLSADELQRGDVLTIPGWLRPTIAADVRLRLLPDAPRPLRHNSPVTLHTGAAETVARVRLLEADEVQPGEETWAQVRLQDPLAVVKGDYFVIRSSDMTIGGGTVVEPYAKRHRRHHLPTLERLRVLEQGSQEDVLLQTLQALEPCDLRILSNRANLSTDNVRASLGTLASQGRVVVLGDHALDQRSVLYSSSGWSALVDRARAALESYHREHPLRSGIQKEELRSRLNLSPQAFPLALLRLTEDGQIVEEGNVVRSPNHQVELNDSQKRRVEAYVAGLRSSPYSPPTDVSLDEDLLSLLIDQGRVVRVNESVVFDAGAYREMLDRIVATARERGKITVAEVRDMFGTSRKYALSLMEYLDQQRITRRVGDDRVLR